MSVRKVVLAIRKMKYMNPKLKTQKLCGFKNLNPLVYDPFYV